MIAQVPAVFLSFMHPPQRMEFLGLSMPADQTIFLVGMAALPALLGWSARRSWIPTLIITGLVLFLFAAMHGRWYKAVLVGDPDFATFGPVLWAAQITSFLGSFLGGLVVRILWDRRAARLPDVSDAHPGDAA